MCTVRRKQMFSSKFGISLYFQQIYGDINFYDKICTQIKDRVSLVCIQSFQYILGNSHQNEQRCGHFYMYVRVQKNPYDTIHQPNCNLKIIAILEHRCIYTNAMVFFPWLVTDF